MIRFRFELRPLAHLQRWSEAPAGWFALTDGWYCIDVGAAELLRYADESPDPFDAHVDYYVARLWEDLVDLLPAVTEPVPGDLTAFLADEPAEGWLSACDDVDQDAINAALWSAGHTLDLGYLTDPPHIRVWRTQGADGDLTTITWTSPRNFAAPRFGRATVPTEDFVAAVSTLHHTLMDAVQKRIAALSTPPNDRQLWDDHRNRSSRLGHALVGHPSSDWPSIRRGARRLLATKRN
ncbi:DUF5984 family protein [Yinghuangia sp. YIM S09857]|uniref:DUF5984 family protein n=1 Tax=Yinghuangia sp. YIM S09857 TaxID=3436929 RepID=UPI003F5341AA